MSNLYICLSLLFYSGLLVLTAHIPVGTHAHSSSHCTHPLTAFWEIHFLGHADLGSPVVVTNTRCLVSLTLALAPLHSPWQWC